MGNQKTRRGIRKRALRCPRCSRTLVIWAKKLRGSMGCWYCKERFEKGPSEVTSQKEKRKAFRAIEEPRRSDRLRRKEREKCRNHYNWRGRRLEEMGFDSYQQYLDSSLWQNIRQAVLEASSHRCYACGHKAKQVHHGNYFRATLSGESMGDLYAVCGRCHQWCERHKKGFKLSPPSATKKLHAKRKSRINAGVKILAKSWP